MEAVASFTLSHFIRKEKGPFTHSTGGYGVPQHWSGRFQKGGYGVP
jgi:hypothetical protein